MIWRLNGTDGFFVTDAFGFNERLVQTQKRISEVLKSLAAVVGHRHKRSPQFGFKSMCSITLTSLWSTSSRMP